MDKGRRITEDQIAKAYAARIGVRLRRGKRFKHPAYEWIVSVPDYVDSSNTFIVEVKNTSRGLLWECSVPSWVYVQVQHHMLVSGIQRCDIPVLDYDIVYVYRVEYNKRFCDKLLNAELMLSSLVSGIRAVSDLRAICSGIGSELSSVCCEMMGRPLCVDQFAIIG